MVGISSPSQHGNRRIRVAVLILITIFYAGGVWQAWQALHPSTASDAATASPTWTTVSSFAANSAETTTLIKHLHCKPKIPLSFIYFSPPNNDNEERAQLFLDILDRALAALHPLLNIDLTVEAKTLFLDFPTPVMPCNGKTGSKYLLAADDAVNFGWHLLAQMPTSPLADATTALVLDSAATGNSSIFRFIVPSAKRNYKQLTALQLSPNTLFAVADNMTADGAAATAQDVLAWLLEDLPIPSNDDNTEIVTNMSLSDTWTASVGHHVASSCLVSSAQQLEQLRSLLKQTSSTGGTKTATVAVVEALHTALDAFKVAVDALKAVQATKSTTLASSSMGVSSAAVLVAARQAWYLSNTALYHHDLAAQPKLPPEHIIALLLPIALPIGLALIQAIGREIKAVQEEASRQRKAKLH